MGRRRGQRSGNLTERCGSWLLRWREDSRDITGRPIRQQVSMVIGKSQGPGKISKREAEREAWERVLSKLDAATLKPAALITMQQFVTARFLPDHVEMTLKAGGKTHYAYCLGHIIPALGGWRMRDISTLGLQDFLNSKRGSLSPQTIAHLKNALSAIFRHAQRCGVWSGELPTVGLMVPRIESPEKRVLTQEQATRLVGTLNGQYSVLAALMLSTGLRIGEAAGLTWKRIDFAAGSITVQESWSREHGYQSPKTARGLRVVPLPASLAAAIAGLRNGAGPDAPVFVTSAGNPIDKRTTASKVLKPAAIRASVPWCSWHTLRHTNATWTDAAGMSPTERMKLLGHADAGMTARYTHPEMERARGAVEGIAGTLMGCNSVQQMRSNEWIS
ncbi:XerC Integrase [uncultured Caudovirales phage]|uniref:Integrase n=1 Tax=uncultured Caudovirales phage TaxID=2100421 RepID=A0A6J5L7P3_9CAUD|nr:XerC Integrase [uncultured Caudovirales phage]